MFFVSLPCLNALGYCPKMPLISAVTFFLHQASVWWWSSVIHSVPNVLFNLTQVFLYILGLLQAKKGKKKKKVQYRVASTAKGFWIISHQITQSLKSRQSHQGQSHSNKRINVQTKWRAMYASLMCSDACWQNPKLLYNLSLIIHTGMIWSLLIAMLSPIPLASLCVCAHYRKIINNSSMW